jgi:hypothetical protein
MTLVEIIQDIHGLEAELARLEEHYGLLSADFYHLYKAGELEQSTDFIQWVGYYEAKLERESRYRERMVAATVHRQGASNAKTILTGE